MTRTRRLALFALGGPLVLGPILAGCDLLDPGLRRGASMIPTIGQMAGPDQIATRQCQLDVAILERPIDDPALASTVWSMADDQSIPDSLRHAWAANGLRLGVITGRLPQDVRDILDAPPPRQVNPATLIVPDGESTVIDLEAQSDELSLLLALPGRTTVGKRFSDARGFIRVRSNRDKDEAVALRLFPELRHGPVRKDWSVSAGNGAFAPQQLVMHNGQVEESFSDLAVTLSLRPGQIAVIGIWPDRKGTLGSFLLSRAEPNSDRRLQRVVLIWASQVTRDPTVVPGGVSPMTVPPDLEPVEPPEMIETAATTSRPRPRPRGLAASRAADEDVPALAMDR